MIKDFVKEYYKSFLIVLGISVPLFLGLWLSPWFYFLFGILGIAVIHFGIEKLFGYGFDSDDDDTDYDLLDEYSELLLKLYENKNEEAITMVQDLLAQEQGFTDFAHMRRSKALEEWIHENPALAQHIVNEGGALIIDDDGNVTY